MFCNANFEQNNTKWRNYPGIVRSKHWEYFSKKPISEAWNFGEELPLASRHCTVKFSSAWSVPARPRYILRCKVIIGPLDLQPEWYELKRNKTAIQSSRWRLGCWIVAIQHHWPFYICFMESRHSFQLQKTRRISEWFCSIRCDVFYLYYWHIE